MVRALAHETLFLRERLLKRGNALIGSIDVAAGHILLGAGIAPNGECRRENRAYCSGKLVQRVIPKVLARVVTCR